MYKKILVPLDGSELSESILEHVITIATGCKVPDVLLIRVRSPLDKNTKEALDADIASKLDEAYQEEASNYLDKIVFDLKKKGIDAKAIVLSGNPAEEIIGYVKDSGVDLIVMSTHGRSGVSRWVFGSVADKVIRLSEVPVLIRPAGIRS